MLCGTSANENALKTAFIHYQHRKRGTPPTKKDLDSSIIQKKPGTPDLSVLAFNGSFHGRSLAMLSVTRLCFLVQYFFDAKTFWRYQRLNLRLRT